MDDRLFELIKQGATIRQLQLILETGIDVNGYNERKETPLMSAMLNVHDAEKRGQIVRILLLFYANVNCRNLRGQTPLMYACILNQTDTLNILLNEPKLDGNIQDFEGNTAFMYACALGNSESVRKLVSAHQHGAIDLDPYIANIEGTTAMEYALDSRDEEIKSLVATVTLELSEGPTNRATDVSGLSDEKEIIKERNDVQNTTKRIKQLAEIIDEDSKIHRTGSAAEKVLTVWKGTEDGNTNVVWSNKTPTPSKENILKRKSALHIHLPKAHEEPQEEDTVGVPVYASNENVCSVPTDKAPNTIYTENKQDLTNTPKRVRKDKKAKRQNGKRSKNKAKIDVDSGEDVFIVTAQPPKREFGEEMIFCNKIYGADLYPCVEEEDKEGEGLQASDIIRNITDKALSNFSKAAQHKVKHEMTKQVDTTGKLNFMQLTPQDRGALLGRTVWSVYGEPLPPIPISARTMETVLRGIGKLRRHLGKAKYQPGRLLSLDPEMWCIIESMRSG